MLNSIQLKNFI